MPFQATSQHQNIIDHLEKRAGNIGIKAVAGSGKTTTLEYIARNHIPKNAECTFLAFNKSIADELSGRMPSHWSCKTFHSACFGSLSASFGKVKVDGGKVATLVKNRLGWDAFKVWGGPILRLVGLAKGHGLIPHGANGTKAQSLIPDDNETWGMLIEKFSIDVPEVDEHGVEMSDDESRRELISLCRKALLASIDDVKTADFDDMLYHAFAFRTRLHKPDFLFVDEAQDTNLLQIELMSQMSKPSTTIVFVGDPAQAIYGFRGAESSAMKNIADRFDATVFPLSVTYRCPQSVVALAQEIVPEIEARPGAPEGQVLISKSSEKTWEPNELVVSRTNAPLVKLAYDLVRKGQPATIIGREIESGIIALLKKIGGKNYTRESTAEIKKKLVVKTREKVRRLELQSKDSLAQQEADKADTLAVFLTLGDTGSDVENEIKRFFAAKKKNGAVLLASIHKSKGLEADVVTILNPGSIPARWAKQEWEIAQENNMRYVALTRAKKTLNLFDM
jgi:DNA helicase II / ATP-dependent DNA helicase PcrA